MNVEKKKIRHLMVTLNNKFTWCAVSHVFGVWNKIFFYRTMLLPSVASTNDTNENLF